MVSAARRPLSPEDRILWDLVAETIMPLKGRDRPSLPPEIEPEPSATGAKAKKKRGKGSETIEMVAVPARPAPRPDPPGGVALDQPTRAKLAKGRLPLEARIDLHGLTQAEAHGLLLGFLHRARDAGLRHVLIITGKGTSKGGDGILRRAVPQWFQTAPFRPLVSGHDDAARHHGGLGALYVRLHRASR